MIELFASVLCMSYAVCSLCDIFVDTLLLSIGTQEIIHIMYDTILEMWESDFRLKVYFTF